MPVANVYINNIEPDKVAKIISIATAVPEYKHTQQHLMEFMEGAFSAGEKEKRIINYLYKHSGIDTRYSVIPDFTLPVDEWEFFPHSKTNECHLHD